MRFKPVPEPPASFTAFEDVLSALPGERRGRADCCGRLVEKTNVPNRQRAADWLVFFRALELAEGEGYVRTARKLESDATRSAFRTRIVGVERILEVVESADTPLETDEILERTTDAHDRGSTSRHERETRFERERVERILEWAVLLDVLERDGDRYRPR